jgi:hypothetical protein
LLVGVVFEYRIREIGLRWVTDIRNNSCKGPSRFELPQLLLSQFPGGDPSIACQFGLKDDAVDPEEEVVAFPILDGQQVAPTVEYVVGSGHLGELEEDDLSKRVV